MSRIGRKLIAVPEGVAVSIKGLDDGRQRVEVKGPRGQLGLDLLPWVQATITGSVLTVERNDDSRRGRSAHGLTRALIANMVRGVSEGFEKVLEIHGLGYKAKLDGRNLVLSIGYSHPVVYPIPEGVRIDVEDATTIRVSGADKQQVGQVAAEIRAFRKPEPYKGKGIRYRGEYVRRKPGKTGA